MLPQGQVGSNQVKHIGIIRWSWQPEKDDTTCASVSPFCKKLLSKTPWRGDLVKHGHMSLKPKWTQVTSTGVVCEDSDMISVICNENETKRTWSITYRRVFFFQTAHRTSGQFPGGAEDTLKSSPSSDLHPSFSCWETFPGFPWLANIHELHKNQSTKKLLRLLSELVNWQKIGMSSWKKRVDITARAPNLTSTIPL